MNSNSSEVFNKEYMPEMVKIGRITGLLGVICSLIPGIALGVAFGIWPDWKALPVAFITGASAFGMLWFVEPISYFPVLGTVGTYMAFLSGNISNMRVPCASTAQISAGVEPGTEQGSVCATLGMAASIVVNVSVLTIGVILGSKALSMLPASVSSALGLLLPALFGALIVQFSLNRVKFGVIALVFAIILYILINMGVFSFLPGASNWLPVLGSVFFNIVVGIATYKNAK